MRTPLVLCLLSLAACGGKAASPATSAPPAAPVAPPPTKPVAPTPPEFVLGDDVRPESYDLELSLDPASAVTSGRVRIAVALARPTRLIWLHARDLTIASAHVRVGAAKPQRARVSASDDFLGLELEREVPAGAATIEIAFAGKVSERDDNGLFRQRERDQWYLYSQFETSYARLAFPCFDEPRFKVPWRVTLRVPEGNLAVANTAVAEERSEAGQRLYRFHESRPLPSYLIAFAAGPFDVVPVEGGKHPTRILVPRGHAAGTSFAKSAALPLLDAAEEYFGIPYPFGKNDLVAIPSLNTFSAMEHPGLITFRMSLLSQADDDWTLPEKRRTAIVMAHEYAHQWFGNLVTPRWWDDIWLNEGFASWMEGKLVARWQPDWDLPTLDIVDRLDAMNSDAVASARKVRQEIRSANDIANGFDRISYKKGQALLMMFEQWMGVEKFRGGIRAYLTEHSFGNATSRDFLASVAAAAGDQNVADAFASFLDQPGVPIVDIALRCAPGQPPRLALRQRRYAAAGAARSAEVWRIPVCVRFGEGKRTGRSCTLLSQPEAELVLDTPRCPAWIAPNADAGGYYHAAPAAPLLAKLLAPGKSPLHLSERIQLAADTLALTRAGEIPAADSLRFAARAVGDPSRFVVRQGAAILEYLHRLVPPEQHPAFARFVRAQVGARARSLGWSARGGEPESQMDLRAEVIDLAANLGGDELLATTARKHLDAWFDDPRAVSTTVWEPLVKAATREGDAALFDKILARAKSSQDRGERGRLVQALGWFHDAKLAARAREVALSGQFELREGGRILLEQLEQPVTRPAAWAFYSGNIDAILAKMPRGAGSYSMVGAGHLCTPGERAEFVSVFEARAQKVMGGPRVYAQVLDRIDQCIALRKQHAAGIEKVVGAKKRGG